MTSREFKERLAERLQRVNIALQPRVFDQLESYYRLLSRWNERINLTALPLASSTGEAFDRLLIEPLLAAPHITDSAQIWFDLGSGGGSPAIPLKILRPRARLTMVESRARKAAFLREVVHALGLIDAHVENARFEEVASKAPRSAQLVTVRAVKGDQALLGAAGALLCAGGQLLWFRSDRLSMVPPGFRPVRTAPLTDGPAELAVLERLFHVEQTS